MWTVDAYLKRLYEENAPDYAFRAENKEEWAAWHHKLQSVFAEDLGGFPEEKVDLAPRVEEETEYPTYVRQRVVFQSDEALEVPAYVLVPKGAEGPMPAVVACHGHGYGSRDIVGLTAEGKDKEPGSDPGYQKNFALELARQGFLVIAPELFGFGDRRLEEDRDKHLGAACCHRVSTYLTMLGKTTAGVRVYDTMRTVDYLTSRDDVDPERIGCMGISGGGLVCGFAAALDERIKVAVVSGYTNTFLDSVMSIHHCIDNFVPSLVKHAEMPDLIGLIAPRPLLVESGTQDSIFPIEATERAYGQIGRIYRLLQAEEQLEKDLFEGEHQISGAKAYDWFRRWL